MRSTMIRRRGTAGAGLGVALLLAACAPPVGSWSTAPTMNQPRSGFTSTLLASGRVLVTGGATKGSPYPTAQATAERFDPQRNDWSSTPPMATARTGHSATRLQDGRVLVAGGHGSTSVEIYDPATTSWRAVAPMLEGRHGHDAVLLASGRVLVVGGNTLAEDRGFTAEVYDPATNRWASAGVVVADGSSYIEFGSAVLLRDGRVLVVEDFRVDRYGHGERYTSGATHLYDPRANSWSNGPATTQSAHAQQATVLGDGRVLLTGGENDICPYYMSPCADNQSETARAELFDPATNRWTLAASMRAPRTRHGAVRLDDGRVLVAGGHRDTDAGPVATAEVYDPATNRWAAAADMRSAQVPDLELLLDDRVLALDTADGSTELFTP